MGVVYEALDRETNTRVALKTLRILNGDSLLRFKTEFRALQDLQHANLVSLGELMQEGGHWFFTMELIEGSDFLGHVGRGSIDPPTNATTVARSGSLSEADTMFDHIVSPIEALPEPESYSDVDEARLRSALGQLICGLRVLHEAGKVHRDVKPSNCLVTPDGRVVLLDFGLITDLTLDRRWNAQPEMLVGTVAYMAPEQAAGQQVGPEADLYSVGVVLYEALTAQVPFAGHAALVIQRKQAEVPRRPREILPEIPADLDTLCMDLLALDPQQRPSADEVLIRLGLDVPELPKRRHTVEPAAAVPTVGAVSFVGRKSELEILQQAYGDARKQAIGLLVSGESGVGKSALVSHFTSLIAQQNQNAVVLLGRCHEREAVPYKAFDGVIDALSHYLRHLPREEAAALLPRRAALLLQVFPVLERVDVIAEAPRNVTEIRDPQELRSRVFGAMRELMGKLGEHHPLVVIIDDIQWSDADSLALLREIVSPPDAPAMLLIATVRTPAAGWSAGSKSGTEDPAVFLPLPEDQVRRLDIPRLSRAEARGLVEQLIPPDAPWSQDMTELVAAESEGHPLFLDELVRHIDHNGERGPEGFHLEAALWARVQGLDRPGQRLVEVVCTAGRPLEQSVAVAAAGLRSDDIAATIRAGQVTRLLRISGPRLSDSIEPYHDRLRAAVVANLTPEIRRAHHESIARTIEAASADPEPLSFHWLEAGNRPRAAHYATLAAIQASNALAFDRAVHFYRQALDLDELSEKVRRGLYIGLGDALTNAGRGGEAAEAYMTAAETSASEKAVELRRRAVEQWLRSGHIQEGFAALGELLGQVGLRLRAHRGTTMISLLWQRAMLRLRGIRFHERPESDVYHADLMKIDTCWSVAAGISLADPLVGFDFVSRSLRLSLRAGEPYRLSRALSLESMAVAARDRKSGERAAAIRSVALELAQRSKNPHAIGLATMADGVGHYFRGSWKHAVEVLDKAEALFREQCNNITAGSPTSRLLALWSLFYLGELPELFRRLPQLLRQAEERGDLQATVNLGSGVSHLMALAEDDPGRAHTEVNAYFQQWKSTNFYFQHWNTFTAQTETNLYMGDWRGALARTDATWPAVQSSWLLRVQKMRIDGAFLLARCRLAAASATPDQRAAHLRHAEREIRRIERERMHWSAPLALLLRAGIASIRGDLDGAAHILRQAATSFDEADMALHAAISRYHLGQLLGGDEGAALHETARDALLERQIRNPAAMAACLAPGFLAD